jgi:hypothetical protein
MESLKIYKLLDPTLNLNVSNLINIIFNIGRVNDFYFVFQKSKIGRVSVNLVRTVVPKFLNHFLGNQALQQLCNAFYIGKLQTIVFTNEHGLNCRRYKK